MAARLLTFKFWRRLFPSSYTSYVFRAQLGTWSRPDASISDAYEAVFPAELDHADQLAALGLDRAALQRRTHEGDLLGVITNGGEIVHRSLLQRRGGAQVEGFSRGFPLAAQQAFIHFCETAPEHRGHGLYPYMLVHMLQWAKDSGYEEVLISCAHDNAASIRGIQKAGFHFRATVTVLAAGWERLAWLRFKESPPDLLPRSGATTGARRA